MDGFVVKGVIGRGGMGQVFEAYDVNLQQPVALKVLHQRSGGVELRARFEKEAQILSGLHHRNIIPVRSGGHTRDGRPYYTMLLVTTGTLLERSDEFRSDVRRSVRTLAGIARAVQHLHDHHIWHRDLKPTNVLIDEEGQPLVADFGVAKYAQEEWTLGFVRVGTHAYMSPEMLTDGSLKCGPKADVWSLGVIAYELLGGRRPFAYDNPDSDLTRLIRSTGPPELLNHPAVVSGVDGPLAALVRRCLSKNPDERPTAGELADDLDRWLAGQPISRPNPKRSRSRWWTVAAGSLVIAAVGITLSPIPRRLWDQPANEANAPLAELLETHRVVTVVGPNGELFRPISTTDPDMARPIPERNGGLVLNTNSTSLLEIASDALPFSVRVTAEVDMLHGSDRCQAGLYAMRLRHSKTPEPGRVDVLVTNGFDGTPFPKTNPPATGPVLFGPHLFYLDRPANHLVPMDRRNERSIPLPEKAGTYRTLTITLSAAGVAATSGEFEFTPADSADFDMWSRETLQLMRIGQGEPLFGHGFGLFVHRSAARFRNVTVERLVR